MWNLMWVLNFTLQLYNPVRDTQPLEKYYHLFVWAFALTAGVYVTVLRLYGCVHHTQQQCCVRILLPIVCLTVLCVLSYVGVGLARYAGA